MNLWQSQLMRDDAAAGARRTLKTARWDANHGSPDRAERMRQEARRIIADSKGLKKDRWWFVGREKG